RINGVDRDQILLGDGSGEILKLCAAAFTGPMSNAGNDRAEALAPPTRGGALAAFTPGRGRMIVADPTFEAIATHARVSNADVVKGPPPTRFRHRLAKMRDTGRDGLVYIRE